MSELIRGWILGLAGAAVFCAVTSQLTPSGAVKNVQNALCGIIMVLALFSPLRGLDMGSYSMNLSKYRVEAEAAAGRAADIRENLSRTIIEEDCAAYILDKAEALGLDIQSAEVELRWSDEGFWYPVSVDVDGSYSRRLSDIIESELGVEPENQKWSAEDED